MYFALIGVSLYHLFMTSSKPHHKKRDRLYLKRLSRFPNFPNPSDSYRKAYRPKSYQYRAFLGLGANLPSPLGAPHLTFAGLLPALSHLGIYPLKNANLYTTQPQGEGYGGVFTNSVMDCVLFCSAPIFLKRLKHCERVFGRKGFGARPLDLDILDFIPSYKMNAASQKAVDCVLPHPRLAIRRFALIPLMELAPHHLLYHQNHLAVIAHWSKRAKGAIFPLRSNRKID